ncbi:MAG: COX15/CtaA family protein [Acidimicrobiia bacterium]|nr:COX15/CtaA family protein [Acidimicrobiia bacterium]
MPSQSENVTVVDPERATPDRVTSLTRFQKFAVATILATLLLVAFGGYTRGSGSGFGCADRWPLCEGGALGGVFPRAEFHMVIEWTHRWLAAGVGLLALATALLAWRDHRRDRRVLWPALSAVVLIGVQGYVGRVIVQRELDSDWVTLHLTMAMAITGLLVVGFVNSFFAGGRRPLALDAPDPAWSRWLAAGATVSLTVLLLGSSVHNRYVNGWPLVNDELVPDFTGWVVTLHTTHRVVAALGLLLLAYLATSVVRRHRPRVEVVLVHGALACYVVNVALGAAHVFTFVRSSGLVAAHLALASLVWAMLLTAAVLARRGDETAGGSDARGERTTRARVEV